MPNITWVTWIFREQKRTKHIVSELFVLIFWLLLLLIGLNPSMWRGRISYIKSEWTKNSIMLKCYRIDIIISIVAVYNKITMGWSRDIYFNAIPDISEYRAHFPNRTRMWIICLDSIITDGNLFASRHVLGFIDSVPETKLNAFNPHWKH